VAHAKAHIDFFGFPGEVSRAMESVEVENGGPI